MEAVTRLPRRRDGEEVTAAAGAGWYVEPANPLMERWWSGEQWAEKARLRRRFPAEELITNRRESRYLLAGAVFAALGALLMGLAFGLRSYWLGVPAVVVATAGGVLHDHASRLVVRRLRRTYKGLPWWSFSTRVNQQLFRAKTLKRAVDLSR